MPRVTRKVSHLFPGRASILRSMYRSLLRVFLHHTFLPFLWKIANLLPTSLPYIPQPWLHRLNGSIRISSGGRYAFSNQACSWCSLRKCTGHLYLPGDYQLGRGLEAKKMGAKNNYSLSILFIFFSPLTFDDPKIET